MDNYKDSLKNRILSLLGAIIVFVLCFAELYAGDNVGLSDNGDFRRVLLVNNLEYENEDNYYYLFKQDYKMHIEGDTFPQKILSAWKTNAENDIYSSPHFMVIKVSKVLNLVANTISNRDDGCYNIAYLAVLYILMLSVSAWGIFTFFSRSKTVVRIAVFLVFIFIFCDIGYVLYFNSFYGEPLQYVSLMMLISVGLLIYRRPSIPKVICFFIVLYFFAGSKLANIPYSVIVCLLSVTFVFLRKDKLFKICCTVALFASACAIINLSTSIPDWMNNDTTYQAVFFGITKESDTPKEDLTFLGVDEKYEALINTNAYMDGDEYEIDITSEEFKKDFYDKVSKLDIALFYLTHPVRMVKKLSMAIENSAYIRPPNVGNSQKIIMDYTNRFSLWSNLRIVFKFLYSPIIIFISFILITVYTVIIDIFYWRRRREEPNENIYMMSAFNVLVVGLWVNLVLPIIGNGEADIAKHMFLFTNCIDIFFAVIVLTIVQMKPKKLMLSVGGILVLTLLFNYTPKKHTMIFGTYNNAPLEWEIYESLNDGTEILITKDAITELRFDDNSNLWEESELREWLNSEFLDGFSEDEKSKILKTTNAQILPTEHKSYALWGDHTHYWNFTKKGASNLSKTAYHYYLDDYVYLPTLDMLTGIGGKDDFWVLCPYGNNTFMERFVNHDGFVLHTGVNNKKGVRAVIRYNAGNITGE